MRQLPVPTVPLTLLVLLLGGCSFSGPSDPVLDCLAPFPELAKAQEEPAPEPQGPQEPQDIGAEPLPVPLAGILAVAEQPAADLSRRDLFLCFVHQTRMPVT